jgi:hypothetical protein
VKPSAIGESLAAYFGVPYEPYKSDRIKPFELLKNLNREFLESSAWVPIDDSKEGMVVLTTDPEKLRGSHVVNNVYPKGQINYRVCCNHEFTKTARPDVRRDARRDGPGIDRRPAVGHAGRACRTRRSRT